MPKRSLGFFLKLISRLDSLPNPKPGNSNPKLQTGNQKQKNLKPETSNPELQTRNLKPRTINNKP
jgi:hypothetical protein